MTPSPCARGLVNSSRTVTAPSTVSARRRLKRPDRRRVSRSARRGRRQPEAEDERRDDHQRGKRDTVARASVEVEVQKRGRAERGEGQDHVLEQPETDHATHRIAARRARFAERPVVDRETTRGAGCGEDAEARDDALRRRGEVELVAVVDSRHVPERQHVAAVGDQLTRQAPDQPRPSCGARGRGATRAAGRVYAASTTATPTVAPAATRTTMSGLSSSQR